MQVIDGIVPARLEGASLSGDYWQVAPGRMLLYAPACVGRYLVEDGTLVTLQRAPDAQEDVLAVQFLDSAMAMVLIQRGNVVMHANAAVTPTGAVAISGESGAGKTTALSALLARGCTMLTDDITALHQREDGVVEVIPGMPHLHMCADAAENLGHDLTGLPVYPWRRMKSVVPMGMHMAETAAPLRAIYLLHVHDGDELKVQKLHGTAKFATIAKCLYGPLLAEQLVLLFPLLSAIAQQAEVYHIYRPANRWAVNELVELILA
ncbi:MAG: hypothetical protein WCJ56_01275 [bacterium]